MDLTCRIPIAHEEVLKGCNFEKKSRYNEKSFVLEITYMIVHVIIGVSVAKLTENKDLSRDEKNLGKLQNKFPRCLPTSDELLNGVHKEKGTFFAKMRLHRMIIVGHKQVSWNSILHHQDLINLLFNRRVESIGVRSFQISTSILASFIV